MADAVAARLVAVRSAFADLAVRLESSGQNLKNGRVPDLEIEAQARNVSGLFGKMSDVVHAATLDLGIAAPRGGLTSLDAIAAFLPTLQSAESERTTAGQTRRAALAVLDRAGRVACPSNAAFEPLVAFHDGVKALRRSISDATPVALPANAQRLVDGTHPINALIGLISANETTPDAQWASWFDAVEANFSHPLAVAAAHLKLTLHSA